MSRVPLIDLKFPTRISNHPEQELQIGGTRMDGNAPLDKPLDTSGTPAAGRTIVNKADERLFIPRAETEALEQDILRRRHIERYAVARQFVHGITVDSACGCGYGTHVLSKNPDVTRAYGIDMNAEAIAFATKEYGSDRVKFINAEIGNAKIELADTLVSIETIEHLENPKVLNDFVEVHAVESLVVSFPIKKTTHYNKFHHWDFKTQDIGDIFFNFTIYKEFLFQYDTCFVCLVRHNRPGRPEKRWRAPDLR